MSNVNPSPRPPNFSHLSLAWMTLAIALSWPCPTSAQDEADVYAGWTHLRSTAEREWSSFPKSRPAERLSCEFDATATDDDGTLTLRQRDVKQSWTVTLNNQVLGRLVRDENDLMTDFRVPGGTLIEGNNQLEIEQTGQRSADDIFVGQIKLYSMAPELHRRAATMQIEINDSSGQQLPGRITITNRDGTMVPVGASSDGELAVREGVLYTVSGSASFGVAAGQYTIFAGRGMEYSVGSTNVTIEAGQHLRRTIVLDRVVDTEGWIACDTHVHTVTHSGHGDATIEERMVTIAGEGIELPIATDHNKHIDYEPIANQLRARSYFTPIIGNEVTTQQGHFNIFPVRAGVATPDHTVTDWQSLHDEMFSVPNVRVAILNHGRDLHSGFRPLSPRHHLSISGENLDDRVLPANAMELINSAAVQTDPMQLFLDWCGMINRGQSVTPVGCSDSHDVSRYIVGQARTYIRCDDAEVSAIDIEAATRAFLEGRVVVSYGMFLNLRANERFGPGELVPLRANDLRVTAEVHAPDWVHPSQVALYVNGQMHQSHRLRPIDEIGKPARIWRVEWTIPRPEIKHDLWLTAVARGEGVSAAYWPTAKPYQPDSTDFSPYTFASTGPLKIDADGDHEFRSAYGYAKSITERVGDDLPRVFEQLEAYHPSVAVQAASILLDADANRQAVAPFTSRARRPIRNAFNEYTRQKRKSVIAKIERQE